MKTIKPLVWVGDSLKKVKGFPDDVKDSIGYALHKVQEGDMPSCAKPMKGFDVQVMEIITNFDTDTYRAVYTVKIGKTVYVLHSFQKKSKTGIKTPKQEIDLIKERLKAAKLIDK